MPPSEEPKVTVDDLAGIYGGWNGNRLVELADAMVNRAGLRMHPDASKVRSMIVAAFEGNSVSGKHNNAPLQVVMPRSASAERGVSRVTDNVTDALNLAVSLLNMKRDDEPQA